jgi:hypothetical protein
MRDIVWVTDRGSNIKKILEEYEVVFCSAHRVNNVLAKVFFQVEKRKKKKNQQLPDEVEEEDEEKMSDSESEGSAEEGGDYDETVMNLQHRVTTNQQQKRPPINQQRSSTKQQHHHQEKTIDTTSHPMTVQVNHLVILKSEIPFEAKRIISLIVSTKKIVKYVKLVCI